MKRSVLYRLTSAITASPADWPCSGRWPQLQQRLDGVQSQLQTLQASAAAAGSEQGTAEGQHAARLKREFAELLTELQRRRSPIGGSSIVTCEVGAH